MEEGLCDLLGATLSSEIHHQSGMDFELQGLGRDPTEKKTSKDVHVCGMWRSNGLYDRQHD